MMQRHHVSYSRARAMLGELKLHLDCGDDVRHSAALQAAVLTAINTGKRAFRGGVTIAFPRDVGMKLYWPGAASLNSVASFLGATESSAAPDGAFVLAFGSQSISQNGLRVICDGWRGGVVSLDQEEPHLCGPDFAVGGVFAAGLAVARAFVSASQISNRDVSVPTGLSLWRPDLPFSDASAVGPALEQLPAKLWLLGLGHLGQAYAWILGLLPFDTAHPMTAFLQDYDEVEDGNWSAGLLCEPGSVGCMKARLCANWLEQRGFRTRIVERPFDEHTRRTADEPRIALAGFDNPEARMLLEEAGFELIVDCGLGASLDHFDRIVLHTFPDASQKARYIWAKKTPVEAAMDLSLLEEEAGECGILLREAAGKAISSSFAGACASALALGEVLRAIHGGKRCEYLKVHLRDIDLPTAPFREERYQLRVARNGIVSRKF